MDSKPIRTRKDHKAALEAIEGLMGAQHNTPEGDRLDKLVSLVQAYEAKHFPLDAPAGDGIGPLVTGRPRTH